MDIWLSFCVFKIQTEPLELSRCLSVIAMIPNLKEHNNHNSDLLLTDYDMIDVALAKIVKISMHGGALRLPRY